MLKTFSIAVLTSLILQGELMSQRYREILLYPDDPQNKRIMQQEKRTYDAAGKLTHISGFLVPRLLVYEPEKPCGTGIIMCPGGGYSTLNVENPGFIASRLIKQGITVFVLVYSLPSYYSDADKPFKALRDVQTAIKLVRQRAAEFNLFPDHIGLWGSSAGGHLAATAATHHARSFIDGDNKMNLRPDFLVLTFPVISFRDGLVHKSSMKNLLGGDTSSEQIHFFSSEEWVDSSTPMTFIVHADDDKTVLPENSVLFYQSLRKAGVSAELHIYEKGGHGFGMEPDAENSWIDLQITWMKNKKLIP